MSSKCAFTLAALAIAFGSTAAVAAATKINKCPTTITLPGAYELDSDLDAKDDCIIVKSDGVTINLNGFLIRRVGGTPFVSAASAVTDQRNVTGQLFRGTTVRNGTVANFINAIELNNGIVEDIKSLDNTNVGILVIQGIVRNSLANGNSNNHGISVGPGSVVSGNVSTNNRTGISAGGFSLVSGNTVFNNTNGGISTLDSMNIVNNNASANGSFGIAVECPSLVLGNTAVGNAQNLLLIFAGCKDEHNVAP